MQFDYILVLTTICLTWKFVLVSADISEINDLDQRPKRTIILASVIKSLVFKDHLLKKLPEKPKPTTKKPKTTTFATYSHPKKAWFSHLFQLSSSSSTQAPTKVPPPTSKPIPAPLPEYNQKGWEYPSGNGYLGSDQINYYNPNAVQISSTPASLSYENSPYSTQQQYYNAGQIPNEASYSQHGIEHPKYYNRKHSPLKVESPSPVYNDYNYQQEPTASGPPFIINYQQSVNNQNQNQQLNNHDGNKSVKPNNYVDIQPRDHDVNSYQYISRNEPAQFSRPDHSYVYPNYEQYF